MCNPNNIRRLCTLHISNNVSALFRSDYTKILMSFPSSISLQNLYKSLKLLACIVYVDVPYLLNRKAKNKQALPLKILWIIATNNVIIVQKVLLQKQLENLYHKRSNCIHRYTAICRKKLQLLCTCGNPLPFSQLYSLN